MDKNPYVKLAETFPYGTRVWVAGEESEGTVMSTDVSSVYVSIDIDNVTVACAPEQCTVISRPDLTPDDVTDTLEWGE